MDSNKTADQVYKPQTFAEITADQIQDWKAKYTADVLHQVEVVVEEEEVEEGTENKVIKSGKKAHYVLRQPSRSVLEALGKCKQDDVQGANRILISNCVLGGDMQILENNGSVYLEVLDRIRLISKKASSSIKKL